MVYGELGRKPLGIIAGTRLCHVSGFYHNNWIMFLENTMNECGYSGIWSNQQLNVSLSVFKI